MSERDTPDTRSIRDGDWYWVNKALIRDHAKDIGALGIAVYNCLAFFVDRDQTCYPTQEKIGRMLGFSRVSVCKAVALLERRGLITVDKFGRYGKCTYRLRPIRCKANRAGVLSTGTPGVNHRNATNIYPSRLNNNTAPAEPFVHRKTVDHAQGFQPTISNEPLALELADCLDDRQNLGLYLSCVRRCPESLLRGVIRDIQQIQTGDIHKDRIALFNRLIRAYDEHKTNNPGD